MLAHGEEPLQPSQEIEYRGMAGKRADTGVPVAYLVGHRGFGGLDFSVRPGVLVPRPETEVLVGAVQSWLEGATGQFAQGVLVDAGCGSGIIAITLARTSGRRVLATDISPVALEVSAENARRHGVQDRIALLQGSWLAPLAGHPWAPSICAVVSNPPYIPSQAIAALERDVRDFEPHVALDGGKDGLEAVRKLSREALEVLPDGGLLAMEIADDQGELVRETLAGMGWTGMAIMKDMAGLPRVVTAQKRAK
jgi:release factor glutamine methyltransferase